MKVEKVVISLVSVTILLAIAALPANSSGGIGIGLTGLYNPENSEEKTGELTLSIPLFWWMSSRFAGGITSTSFDSFKERPFDRYQFLASLEFTPRINRFLSLYAGGGYGLYRGKFTSLLHEEEYSHNYFHYYGGAKLSLGKRLSLRGGARWIDDEDEEESGGIIYEVGVAYEIGGGGGDEARVEEPTIGRLTTDLDSISVGERTLVTLAAHIDLDLDRGDPQVKLLRLDEHNQVMDTIGYLHDDGLEGDAVAGDDIFTIQAIFTEKSSTQIKLQVSVVNTIRPKPAYSNILVVLATEQPQLNVDVGGSLRLMTFNTQLLTSNLATWMLEQQQLKTEPDIEKVYGMDNEDRAEAIAKAILGMEPLPDIIALQEVFDEDGKDGFEDALKETYPHYVYKLDSDDFIDFDPEDSGLMLFSRSSFANLPDDQYKAGDVTAYSKKFGQVKDWDEVAFIEFDEHSWPDSLSNKGVGFVRIRVAPSRYINVAFTHLEASYGSDDMEEAEERATNRKAQLDDVRKIIQGSLNDSHLDSEQVFVMGDLNIDGNLLNRTYYWGNKTKTTWNNWKSTDDDNLCHNYEWDYHFNRYLKNSFFSTYLSDSWMYDTAKTDPGQTTSGDFPNYLDDDPTQGERLDYILHSNNNAIASATDMLPGRSIYCIQHIRRVWEPALGAQQYSDHLGVMADINLYAPYCNPLIAYVAKPQPDAVIQGKITYHESMQWYRVEDTGGSYSIHTSGNVKFEVYEAKDLSRPIRDLGELTEWGLQFSIPEVPFYIRAFSDNPLWTGDYTISIHLHMGASKEDAILLDPLATYLPNSYQYGYLYQMPTISQINNDDIVWFKILPEKGDTGGLSSMKAMVDFLDMAPGFDDDNFTVDLMTNDDDVIAVSKQTPYPYSKYPSAPPYDMWREELKQDQLSEKRYYLRVHSKYPSTKGYMFVIHWQTDLTHFVPEWLKCYEQDDNTGDDDIYCWIRVDGVLVQNEADLGDFDDGDEDPGEYGTRKRIGIMKYRYVDNIEITLREHEGYPSAVEWTTLGTETIGTLPMDEKKGATEKKWIKGDPDDDPDYDYRLTGKLFHQLKK